MNEWGGEENGEGIPVVLICVKERERWKLHLTFPFLPLQSCPLCWCHRCNSQLFSPPPSYPTTAVSSRAMFRVETMEGTVHIGYMIEMSFLMYSYESYKDTSTSFNQFRTKPRTMTTLFQTWSGSGTSRRPSCLPRRNPLLPLPLSFFFPSASSLSRPLSVGCPLSALLRNLAPKSL